MRRMTKVLGAVAVALLAIVSSAGSARAQGSCVWGCLCQGNACECNSNGSGSSCATGGTGCVVTKCDTEIRPVGFAADGSVIRLASWTRPRASSPAGRLPAGNAHWEYVARGRAVARHCSGVVVLRYFHPDAAAAVRRRQQVIVI